MARGTVSLSIPLCCPAKTHRVQKDVRAGRLHDNGRDGVGLTVRDKGEHVFVRDESPQIRVPGGISTAFLRSSGGSLNTTFVVMGH